MKIKLAEVKILSSIMNLDLENQKLFKGQALVFRTLDINNCYWGFQSIDYECPKPPNDNPIIPYDSCTSQYFEGGTIRMNYNSLYCFQDEMQ